MQTITGQWDKKGYLIKGEKIDYKSRLNMKQ